MEIRSLHGIFFGVLCVWRNYMFRSYFLSVCSFCMRIFATTAVRFLEFNLCMVFFFLRVCVGVWRSLHALILLFSWGFCCWFEFFLLRIFAAAFRFSGGGILSYFVKKTYKFTSCLG
jgi:hypothetical protein